MIEQGQQYGRLTVVSLYRGRKRKHPTAECECECGNSRKVRQTSLRTGRVMECAQCAVKSGWGKRHRIPEAERKLNDRESTYRCNARRMGVVWHLERQQFRDLLAGGCLYCGTVPAGGIDRLDNREGYTLANAASCCATCNYAKRDMSAGEFLAWVRRVFRHAFQ